MPNKSAPFLLGNISLTRSPGLSRPARCIFSYPNNGCRDPLLTGWISRASKNMGVLEKFIACDFVRIVDNHILDEQQGRSSTLSFVEV